MNGHPVFRFDGQDDFLSFNEINTVRTIFLVVKRNTGSQGFLLGHENSYAFHPGSNSVWSSIWTDSYLLNGILHVDGSSYEGLAQDYSYGSPTIIAIRTTGMLPASSFSKDRANDVYWDGDLAELIIYQEELPVPTMRMVEGVFRHTNGALNPHWLTLTRSRIFLLLKVNQPPFQKFTGEVQTEERPCSVGKCH